MSMKVCKEEHRWLKSELYLFLIQPDRLPELLVQPPFSGGNITKTLFQQRQPVFGCLGSEKASACGPEFEASLQPLMLISYNMSELES
ncbi:hypothetical protein FOYG_08287 [Fusarium oxysporum NRRL 32931]|uniref:Uncharacterized protein n=1 Tax=Fusarium oxysporum NRRL 32931 TaxID=660029 RepID=W9IEQ7_FUSOX|nr:hypothetical protein FOYG_08287 [Fusarium oxysporum NRRL 32931]